MQPQSLLMGCDLTDCNISVSGENYQGGITGALTNSYAINCGASGSISVKATGSYAGGAVGTATVGWVTNLGKDEVSDPSLLKTVGNCLQNFCPVILKRQECCFPLLVSHHPQSLDVI